MILFSLTNLALTYPFLRGAKLYIFIERYYFCDLDSFLNEKTCGYVLGTYQKSPKVDFLSSQSAPILSSIILGSCLLVDPSPHNFNSDPLLLNSSSSQPPPPPPPPPIVKINAFSVIKKINSF